ncbi:MAG: hypothetical protein GY869_18065, partial [Planctomycetes bacterium]|nr:hypothetical protein [Planctomycetota bacterium]
VTTYGFVSDADSGTFSDFVFVNNIFEVGDSEEDSAVIRFDSELIFSGVIMHNNNFQGPDIPDKDVCLLDLDGCITTISDVNECEWYFCKSAGGNTDEDPDFDTDYHLAATSALIDAGISPTPFVDGDYFWYDLDMVSRPQGEGYDMGAYEFIGSSE